MQKFTRPSTNPCFMQVCKEAGKKNYYSFMFIAVVDMEAGIARTRWTSPTKRMCPGSSSLSWEARASPSSARDTRWPTKERTGRSLSVGFSFSSTFSPIPAETILYQLRRLLFFMPASRHTCALVQCKSWNFILRQVKFTSKLVLSKKSLFVHKSVCLCHGRRVLLRVPCGIRSDQRKKELEGHCR